MQFHTMIPTMTYEDFWSSLRSNKSNLIFWVISSQLDVTYLALGKHSFQLHLMWWKQESCDKKQTFFMHQILKNRLHAETAVAATVNLTRKANPVTDFLSTLMLESNTTQQDNKKTSLFILQYFDLNTGHVISLSEIQKIFWGEWELHFTGQISLFMFLHG